MSLMAVIVTGASAWMVFGQDKVTRSEMVEYVKHQAPWILEKGVISAGIESNREDILRLTNMVEKLVESNTELVVEQRVLTETVKALIENGAGER